MPLKSIHKPIVLTLITLMGTHPGLQAKEKPWKFSTSLSYVNTTGNTRTEIFGSKNTFLYDWKHHALELKAKGYSSRENNRTTAENYSASEKWDWKLKSSHYVFQLGSWEKDRFAGIDSRSSLGAGYGTHLIDSPKNKLKVEIGGQHTWEDPSNEKNKKFASGRGFGEYKYIFSEKSEFAQSFEYLDDFKNSDAYRITSLTSIKSLLTSILSLKVSYEVKFNNDPPLDTTKTDTLTTVALVLDL